MAYVRSAEESVHVMDNELRVCLNCGGLTMAREGTGWACQDPDCLQYLVVVYPDNTLHLPTIFVPKNKVPHER
jgi:hypothetical protein